MIRPSVRSVMRSAAYCMVCPIVESLVAEVPIVKLYSPEEEAVETEEPETAGLVGALEEQPLRMSAADIARANIIFI